MIVNNVSPGVGYPKVRHGSSFVMAVELGPHGPSGRQILTYSQSANPNSPWYGDQTRSTRARAGTRSSTPRRRSRPTRTWSPTGWGRAATTDPRARGGRAPCGGARPVRLLSSAGAPGGDELVRHDGEPGIAGQLAERLQLPRWTVPRRAAPAPTAGSSSRAATRRSSRPPSSPSGSSCRRRPARPGHFGMYALCPPHRRRAHWRVAQHRRPSPGRRASPSRRPARPAPAVAWSSRTPPPPASRRAPARR